MIQLTASVVLALAIGGVGGGIFYLLGAPLPWTLGSLTATAIAALLGSPFNLPFRMRRFVLPIVGVLAGSAFTPAIVASIPGWFDAILLVVVASAVLGAAGYVFFRICGFDHSTAFFAAAPAGIGEMSLIGSTVGANVRSLVLVHSARIICVVFAVPFILQWMLGSRLPAPSRANNIHDPADWLILGMCALLGYLAGRFVRFPAAAMVAALLFSALVHAAGITAATPPNWLVAVVQVVTGSVLGARFLGIQWREVGSTILAAAGWALILILATVAFSAAGSWALDRSFASLTFALAPGGMVEMTVISFALAIDVAFVATCQIVRILLVVTLAPTIFRLVTGQKPTDAKTPPGGTFS